MFLWSFIILGTICLIGQLILDNTRLTPGHVTSIFVVFGAILGFFGIYDMLLELTKAGAIIPITSFGHLLFDGAWYGYRTGGFLGLFTNFLTTTSAGITGAIIFSFILSLFFNAKD